MLGAQGCTLHSIDNYGSLTAQKRSDSKDRSGFSFVNCTVTGSSPHLLGRAWGPYSRVVYAYTYMENSIIPFGWSNWNDAYREEWVLFSFILSSIVYLIFKLASMLEPVCVTILSGIQFIFQCAWTHMLWVHHGSVIVSIICLILRFRVAMYQPGNGIETISNWFGGDFGADPAEGNKGQYYGHNSASGPRLVFNSESNL